MVGLYVAFCMMLSCATPATKPSSPLNGVWDVVRVSVDQRDQPRWLYRPDEPELLGREVVITTAVLSIKHDECLKPTFTPKTTTWHNVLRSTFARPPKMDMPRTPDPEDFDLQGSPTKQIRSYWLKCRPPRGNSQWPGSWFVATGLDKMVMSYGESAVLFLERRAPGVKPRPSFDCAKAKSVSEQAICASVNLAAWDRSLAMAWNSYFERASSEERKRLTAEQPEWLKRRDACGTNQECLEDIMEERTRELRF